MDDRSIQELIDRARGGDRAALDALVDAFYPTPWALLFTLSRRYHRAGDIAQDLTQEVMITFFLKKPFGPPPDPTPPRIRAWLRTVAWRLWNRYVSDPRREEELGEQLADGLVSREPDAVEAVSDQELAARLRMHIAFLPADHKEVLRAHYVEGRSFEELSLELGVPAGTLRWRASQARIRLRQRIEADPELVAWLGDRVPLGRDAGPEGQSVAGPGNETTGEQHE